MNLLNAISGGLRERGRCASWGGGTSHVCPSKTREGWRAGFPMSFPAAVSTLLLSGAPILFAGGARCSAIFVYQLEDRRLQS